MRFLLTTRPMPCPVPLPPPPVQCDKLFPFRCPVPRGRVHFPARIEIVAAAGVGLLAEPSGGEREGERKRKGEDRSQRKRRQLPGQRRRRGKPLLPKPPPLSASPSTPPLDASPSEAALQERAVCGDAALSTEALAALGEGSASPSGLWPADGDVCDAAAVPARAGRSLSHALRRAKSQARRGFPAGAEDEEEAAEAEEDESLWGQGSSQLDGARERGLPAVMRCFDTAKIYVKAGDGGDGVVAFRREKFVPDGGPSGGNGGKGGDVYLLADPSLNSLLSFRRVVHFRATRGSHGQGKCRHGHAGDDVVIHVPPGTVVREVPGARPTLQPMPLALGTAAAAMSTAAGEEEAGQGLWWDQTGPWAGEEDSQQSSGQPLPPSSIPSSGTRSSLTSGDKAGPAPQSFSEAQAQGQGDVEAQGQGQGRVLLELVHSGQRELLLAGGRGGRGNAAFKTGRNKAPQLAEHGEAGPEMWVELELKLVADVGIVGAPNAGKSTLLSVISAAKPKIDSYPFTTLVPNLGVVPVGAHLSSSNSGSFGQVPHSVGRTLVFADIPGLLEGAHSGVGLGHEFLRHTERCSALVHLVDGSGPQPLEEFHAVRAELDLFSPELASKPYVIVLNKMDLLESRDAWPAFCAALQHLTHSTGQQQQEELLGPDSSRVPVLCMSGVTGEGVWEVVAAAAKLVEGTTRSRCFDEWDEEAPGAGAEGMSRGWAGASDGQAQAEQRRRHTVAALVQQARRGALTDFTVSVDKHTHTFLVQGEGLHRFLQMTNWEYFESARRVSRVLEACGVTAALRQRGVEEGDRVVIGEMEFDWSESNDWSASLGSSWQRGTRGSRLWPH